MEQTIVIAGVLTCKVTRWTYNEGSTWKAPDITVGDEDPRCDTYTTGPGTGRSEHPRVDTCKVTACSFNSGETWVAAGVTVGDHYTHADCLTYRGR